MTRNGEQGVTYDAAAELAALENALATGRAKWRTSARRAAQLYLELAGAGADLDAVLAQHPHCYPTPAPMDLGGSRGVTPLELAVLAVTWHLPCHEQPIGPDRVGEQVWADDVFASPVASWARRARPGSASAARKGLLQLTNGSNSWHMDAKEECSLVAVTERGYATLRQYKVDRSLEPLRGQVPASFISGGQMRDLVRGDRYAA